MDKNTTKYLASIILLQTFNLLTKKNMACPIFELYYFCNLDYTYTLGVLVYYD